MIINYYFTIVFAATTRFAIVIFRAKLDGQYYRISCSYCLCYQHVILVQTSLRYR